MRCRHCNNELQFEFIDLINSPASNSFLTKEQLNEPELFFPLKIYVCDKCFLVQVDEYKKSTDIFNHEYVYFSSYSTSWLAHCKKYADKMCERFSLNQNSLVMEIASNDGYMLQYFHEKGIPTLGIEPTKNTAEVAISKGINTIVDFFSTKFASESLNNKGIAPDLIAAKNVLAHVPDINDFVKGLKIALGKQGVITIEFPHLLKLVQECQFDTIYHEHFSYLSFYTVNKIFESYGLTMFDVEELPTHGGSLRIYAQHKDTGINTISDNVAKLLQKEKDAGLLDIQSYSDFKNRADIIRSHFNIFISEQNLKGKKVVAYGAAAKGNTFLNYCGTKTGQINYCIDASPHKQNKYMPGSHIPVVSEDILKQDKPDYIIILPWNLRTEITEQLSYVREWGAKFVIAIPELTII